MITRTGARTRGAAAFLPVIDSGWFERAGTTRSILILVGLAAVAILALLVAAGALRNAQRSRSRNRIDDEELFTATPLPMSKEELARLSKRPPHHAYSEFKLPRWVQLGSLVVALGFTWAVADRVRPNRTKQSPRLEASRPSAGASDGGRDDAADSPEDLDLSPDSAPRFSFRAADWVASGAGCEGRLQVTQGETSAWNLTARVHDGQGQLLDSARTRVSSLQAGDVVAFTFAGAACDRIGAWDVRGDRGDRPTRQEPNDPP